MLFLYDRRHKTPNEATIDIIEVDMNNNIGIAYLTPDITLAIKNLKKHIRIIMQSKGYENFLGENICLSIMFLGKAI